MRQLLVLSIFLIFSSLYSQSELKYQLKKGDVFRIHQHAEQQITQEVDGAEHEITNIIDGLLEFNVLGEVNGAYEIRMVFKDLKLHMDSSIHGELLRVEATEVVEGDVQSRIFNSLLDVPVYMLWAKNGEILEVTGGDSLVAKMVQASGLEDEFSLKMMQRSLEKEFGSEALSNSYEQMTFIYPGKPIKVGESWENEFVGKLSSRNKWTLNEMTEQEARISGISEVVIDLKEPATTMKLNGKQQTSVTTDLATGFIVKMIVEGWTAGVSTVAQMGEQEIPTTIKSTITYELIQ